MKGLLSSSTYMFDMHCDLWRLNAGNVRIFVIMSVNWLSVLMYAKSITSFLHQYLMTWCLMSTCFVRFVVMKLIVMLMAALLSSWNRTGSCSSMLSSLRHVRSHIMRVLSHGTQSHWKTALGSLVVANYTRLYQVSSNIIILAIR